MIKRPNSRVHTERGGAGIQDTRLRGSLAARVSRRGVRDFSLGLVLASQIRISTSLQCFKELCGEW